MIELKELASSLYDIVILDTPPLGVCSDSAAVSKFFTSFIAVALAGKTPIPTLSKKIAEYPDLKKKLAGLVLNKAPVTRENGYYRYAYYQKNKDKATGLKI
jgi:Mrp family chromosome partitioning ATPase